LNLLKVHGAALSLIKSLALANFLAISAVAANAADVAPAPAPVEGWTVTLGLGPQVVTSFPGARTVRVWPTGNFSYRKPNEPAPFVAPDDGFGIALLDFGWIKAGPVGRIMSNRGLSDGNGNFYGLRNVNWTLELGGFLDVYLTEHLRTHLELRQGVNGHDGLVGNVAIDAIQKFDAFTFSIGPRLALGNNQFMQSYFSVSPSEALANGKVYPYQAYGGVTSFGGLATVKYDFNPNWSATLFGGYDRLMNSAAASPIPNRLGSLNEYTGGVIIAYSFNFKGIGMFGF
jgi:outer membrane scaffolding protein for murein synthesis (MipA/OmpV family)